MSEPTQYDLVQDARLDAHERLITPQDRERYGIEWSFPVVGQQVSDDEFQQMMLSTAAGILDQGGRPFGLKNFDDASRTAQLTVSTTTKDAKAAINGFFYRLVQDMTISLPMPSIPTTYHVCLTYDPLGHGRQSGPISVQVYAGPPPYREGLLHVELWKVECKPSQLLSQAAVQYIHPKITPAINVDARAALPEPGSQLWGTRCLIRSTGEEVIAVGHGDTGPARWETIRPAKAAGRVTITMSNAANATATITFPPGRFESAPDIFITKQTPGLAKSIPYVQSVTATGATIGVFNGDSSPQTGSVTVAWRAYQQ